jgi:heptosyltransferase I
MAGAANDPPIKKLRLVRLSAMGDVIHTLPAAQALREAFPQAEIGWLIEERWAELLCAPGTPRRGSRSAQRPLADWVHTVKLKQWQRSLFSFSTLQQIATAVNDVRSMHNDIAIDLQGAIRSAVFTRWSGARIVYGAVEPREAPASLWYTRPVITRGEHVVEQNLSLVEAVTQKKIAVLRIEFPRDDRAENDVAAKLAENKIGQFAILNPGAGWGAKRWPAERYGEVAAQLAERGLHSIVNYGPGEDELAHQVEAASRGTARAMKTSISELIALTRRACLFIGGDTGPMHLAAALSVPVVAIFGPTNPARNGPYGTRSIVLRNPASLTSHARRAEPDEAMLDITTESVAAAAHELLNTSPTEVSRG